MIVRALALLLCLCVPASAQLTLLGVSENQATGGGGCSNALDFSQACNSQYLLVGVL